MCVDDGIVYVVFVFFVFIREFLTVTSHLFFTVLLAIFVSQSLLCCFYRLFPAIHTYSSSRRRIHIFYMRYLAFCGIFFLCVQHFVYYDNDYVLLFSSHSSVQYFLFDFVVCYAYLYKMFLAVYRIRYDTLTHWSCEPAHFALCICAIGFFLFLVISFCTCSHLTVYLCAIRM